MLQAKPVLSGSQAPPHRTRLTTFDRGFSADAEVRRPDRYRALEAGAWPAGRIARGGGYSYCAASFGAGGAVIDMTCFNRVLRFEPAAREIEVEAGMTLGDLLTLTAPAQLWLPVQPGYPDITIGGCIAANVHGKNPARAGTFRHSIVNLTLVHPERGSITVDAASNPLLFDLTCGGFGLTGVIMAATLRLEPLPGSRLSMRRTMLGSLADGLASIRTQSSEHAFAYTWHDAAPSRRFGRGVAYHGTFINGTARMADVRRPYRRINPNGRRMPVSGWNRWTNRLFNWGHRTLERVKPEVNELTLFDSLFPFARRPGIFLMFGNPGFVEYQAIVPDDRVESYLSSIEHLFRDRSLPSVLVSMKQFRGTRRWLRFEGDGVCVTLYLARTAAAVESLPALDRLALETGSVVNIMKDSRLPASAVRAMFPEYDAFREELRRNDPQRLFRSDLSERLGL